ncbi:hypothetical protein JNB63_10240 [Microbacterium trichothecenolyticum]|uniref:GDSL-type esterase/lipase family protein n=1 Tax=Microbacterium trichothecenolyticum TaxID=69370 RepID=UPI001C6E0810|nr:GDSL-type esterase/lipase family protein [Microbacterium trichothecenolyticum]MBW9120476.1 hypothetical protein [Microbacterium trichothecenolyticum]
MSRSTPLPHPSGGVVTATPELYEERVAALERDLMSPAPQGVVVLAGSSVMQDWEASGAELAPLRTVNVGIAGTRVGDQAAFVKRLVYPFRPRALVLYVGSNNITGVAEQSQRPESVVAELLDYFDLVHVRYPGLPIYYVGINEAPVREPVHDDIRRANGMIAAHAASTASIRFIDTSRAFLGADGHIDESLFLEDRLHLNERGYRRFAAPIREALLRDLHGDVPRAADVDSTV